jgi:hypothetical protein
MIGRRGHDQGNREHNQRDRHIVQLLLSAREPLREGGSEDGDQLKSTQRLNARKHHAALVEESTRRISRGTVLPTGEMGYGHPCSETQMSCTEQVVAQRRVEMNQLGSC